VLTQELTRPPPLELPLDDHTAPPLSDGAANESSVGLPGRPAQLYVLEDRVLVTIRDPGLLLAFSLGEMKELGRVELPADAWGLAVSHDGKRAFVTSAWSAEVSAVDLDAMKPLWSVKVAREPRGITVTEDGGAVYVSHLVGSDLTKITTDGPAPKVVTVALPPDPLRTIAGDVTVRASLGYALLLSEDGQRLFAARQALGALWNWQGNPTVDGLVVATDEPLAPTRGGRAIGQLTLDELKAPGDWDLSGAIAGSSHARWVQPRAMVMRSRTHHILVASEGASELIELDALSIAPGVVENRSYRLGGLESEVANAMKFPPRCGAPTGIALSDDDDVAWVYCRTTDEIVAVRLHPTGMRGYGDERIYLERAAYHRKLSPWGPFAYARLAVPERDPEFALGRRLFFDSTEPTVSRDMACAGCHPEGREDAHVWREKKRFSFGDVNFNAGPSLEFNTIQNGEPVTYGFPRQTPMLAGRVGAVGPYGWHAESPTLVDRLKAGFGLHRDNDLRTDGGMLRMRADPLVRFLREGLVPPPSPKRPLTEEEARGKAIFESPRTECATCHLPSKEYTDRSARALPRKTPPLFDDEKDPSFKVPSLLFVGGTPPYYHDGSAPTLEYLVEKNGDSMGKTSHLSKADQAALVAFMRTL
jgi:mono/diheme cytochrome c family protein